MKQETIDLINEFIPFGQENAISRADLVDLFGICDRSIREYIEMIREQNNSFVIISSSKYKGYYKTTDKKEIESYIEEQTRRAKKILWNLKTAKQFLGEKDQLKIEWR